MNQTSRTLVKTLALCTCLVSIGWGYGQKERKTFNETFKVAKAAVLHIDTSHADIEFETWKKDEVVIEATIEIEGANAEEIERYLEKESFEILGNSQKVDIKTTGGNRWTFGTETIDVHHQNFEIPDIPEMDDFDVLVEGMEFPEIPELPRAPVPHFDYKAFKEDGEAYMETWKKEFDKSFDKEYKEKMEAWGQKMEQRQEAQEKRREVHLKRMEEHAEKRVERMEERTEERQKRMEEMQQEMKENMERRLHQNRSVPMSSDTDAEPNVFYFSTDGKNNNYKVKKTIKIKIPKGMKIKMNVRHGEVKLADNTMHLDAKLSHATLWAATIDGDQTTIMASYSPVSVDRWYLGYLKADYSENVGLKEVFDIRLNAVSSNVTIDKLIKTAHVKNDFGALKIASIAKDFTTLDFTMQNAELDFKIPPVAFDIYVNGTSSTFDAPASLLLDSTKNGNNTVNKGYHLKKAKERSIVINSMYSNVQLH